MNRILLIIPILLILFLNKSHAQCGCPGAPAGGATQLFGTTNAGVLPESGIRAALFYRYSSGSEILDKDVPSKPLFNTGFNTNYLGLLAGYGISNKFTIEAESGYFIGKTQEFGRASNTGRGFSHLQLSGKYDFYSDSVSNTEFATGAGIKFPLAIADSGIPQNSQPSTGAFGGVIHLFFHKGFKDEGLHLFFISRTELNTYNKIDYKYGYAFYNSIFGLKSLLSGLSAILEVRSEYRTADAIKDSIIDGTGGFNLLVCPQLNFQTGDFSFSLITDIPVYNYLYGIQVKQNFALMANISWQFNLNNSKTN